jgi:hypothetical protein
MQQGTWHLYDGHYCPKCHSRRIHREYIERLLQKDGSILKRVLSRNEVQPLLHKFKLRYGLKTQSYDVYPESLDLDDKHSIGSENWRCRACGSTFKKPLILQFYGDEFAVERSHFGCPSYHVLMKRGARKG